MFNFIIFVLVLVFLIVSIIARISAKENQINNQSVNLISSNLVALQRIQLELGLHEMPQWNGYRNELRLYRLRMKRSDAKFALNKHHVADIRIENISGVF